MRWAHFIQRYPPALGGSEAYFQRLGQFLAGRGDAVTVWTTTALDLEAFWSPRARCLPAGESTCDPVTIRRFPLWRMRGRRWLLKPLSMIPQRSWQALTLPCNPVSFAMRQAVESCDEPIDAVHATAFPYAWPIVCARRLARRLDVPFLLTPFLHLGDPDNALDRTRRQYTSPPLRALLRSADAILVQTPSEREAVRQLGIDERRIHLQGLGVNAADSTGGHRTAARAAWSVDDRTVVIGHLANLSIEKGTVDLLAASRKLVERDVDHRIVLAGPDMTNARTALEQADPARVIRLGPLSDEAKRDFFAGIDVFALPSRSDSFGLVLLEAWANGIPNVVYRAGGPADLIQHGEDGLQSACGDVEALSEQLERFVIDADLRRHCGSTGRRRVASEFRWQDKLELVSEVAAEAISNRRTKSARNTVRVLKTTRHDVPGRRPD